MTQELDTTTDALFVLFDTAVAAQDAFMASNEVRFDRPRIGAEWGAWHGYAFRRPHVRRCGSPRPPYDGELCAASTCSVQIRRIIIINIIIITMMLRRQASFLDVVICTSDSEVVP